MGSDTSEKQELEGKVLAKADLVVNICMTAMAIQTYRMILSTM
ncbi:MAG: hypothetical protein HRT72_08210 [Flavobacteriales bacterium]|nr:hypothetical protein [Flavobacteriales bacterium]